MPIYEYVCEIAAALSKVATVAEQAVPARPTCGFPRTKRK
jgi:predicted nucleic acid-binding Zn ribbon protein